MSNVGAAPATESGAGKGRTTKATSAKSTADRTAAKSSEPASRERGGATAPPATKKAAKGASTGAEEGAAARPSGTKSGTKGKAAVKEATTAKEASTGKEATDKKSVAAKRPAPKESGSAPKAVPAGGAHSGDSGQQPAKAPAARGAATRGSTAVEVVADERPAEDAGSNGSVATRGAGGGPGTTGERSRHAKKPAPAEPEGGAYHDDEKFLEEQRVMLQAERAVYSEQATALKAEADSLAQEREPGDVQFDEESGEGGTVTVDRERDLALSAQALAAVEEIDAALARIEDHTYGACERCHQPIPKARLRALPFARLCVACKNGGLSRR